MSSRDPVPIQFSRAPTGRRLREVAGAAELSVTGDAFGVFLAPLRKILRDHSRPYAIPPA
jgi:hypothetical protein